MLWQYTKDVPYSPADKAKIVDCLNQIEARLSPPGKSDTARAEEDRAMIDSLKRNFARDFTLDLTKNDQAVMWRERPRSFDVPQLPVAPVSFAASPQDHCVGRNSASGEGPERC
jgi:hypothetical protein